MDRWDKFSLGLAALNPDSQAFATPLFDVYISLLEEAIGDMDGFISWFIYDNDFGRLGLIVVENGFPIPIKSIDDAYDYLTR